MASIDNNNLLASAIISPIVMLVISMATGSYKTMNTTIGKIIGDDNINGEEKEHKIRSLTQQGLIFSFCIGAVSIALLMTNYPVALYITNSTVVADLVFEYFLG